MKQSLIIFTLFATIAFGFSASAHDEDTATSGSRLFRGIHDAEEVRAKMQERQGTIKENLGERREAAKTRFDEFRKQKISMTLEFMVTRFAAAIERLRGIATRIETRIEKIEDETDTTLTDARHHLDEARASLDDAEDSLGDISTSSAQLFIDEAAAGERFGALRGLFRDAKESIKAARMHLGEALRATGWDKTGDQDSHGSN